MPDEAVYHLGQGSRVEARVYATKLGNSNAAAVWELIRTHDWSASLTAEEVVAKAFRMVELMDEGCTERDWFTPFPGYEEALRKAVKTHSFAEDLLRNAQPVQAGFRGNGT